MGQEEQQRDVSFGLQARHLEHSTPKLPLLFSTSEDTLMVDQTLSLKEQIRAEKAKRSLYEFAKQAWHVLEPATEFRDGWHMQAIAEHLEAASRGEIQNLCMNIPPRHAKSLFTSVFWNAWAWTHRPETQWLCASYALSLSLRDNRKCKILIESDWYKKRWGTGFSIAKDQNQKIRFENNHKGYRLAVSTESAATGEGGDILIVDDPLSARDGNSPNRREDAILWWDTTMATRLNDPKTGCKVIIMQRLHQQDLTGHILEQGGYVHLCLPAEYEPTRKCFTTIGWSDPREEEGELLWPKQMPELELKKLKRAMGPQAYAAQFQQNPVPAGGAIFKQEWFRSFRQEEQFYLLRKGAEEKRVLKAACWLFSTVDLAASKSSSADYTVIATWAVTPEDDLLLLEVQRERWDGGEIESALQTCYYRYFQRYLVIESVAFQLTMFQKAVRMGLPVQSYKPLKDKVSRAISASTFYANGKVYHLQFASYLHDYEQELLLFPKGEHDDQVDTLSMATEICFNPTQPNIRNFEGEEPELVLTASMERGRNYDWGDL